MKTPDEIGPEAQIFVSDAATGMRGILVVDSTALGPCGGGTRMLPDLAPTEIADLARAMTYKFAILGLPRGGSKAGIWADPQMPPERKRAVLEAFGRALSTHLQSKEVAVGPDMGVTAADVSAIYAGARAENVRTGLFERPFEGDAAAYHITGYGVVAAVRAACCCMGLELDGATVAIEGFGQVGAGAARHAARLGARVVAISTLDGLLYDARGLDIVRLLALRREVGDRCVSAYGAGTPLPTSELYALPVDVLVPGARPYAIDEAMAGRVRARLLASGGNISLTSAAEEALFRRGVISVPDFIANAGGAIASWVDMLGGDLPRAFRMMDALIGRLTLEVIEESRQRNLSPHRVAVERARRRVLEARGRTKPSFQQAREQIAGIFAKLDGGLGPAPAQA